MSPGDLVTFNLTNQFNSTYLYEDSFYHRSGELAVGELGIVVDISKPVGGNIYWVKVMTNKGQIGWANRHSLIKAENVVVR